jgi:hypothetical protein
MNMDTKFLIGGVALITAVGAACSANSGDQSRVPGAGGSGQGGAGAMGGTINPGGSTSTGGAGGSIIVDGGGGSSGGDPDAACQAVSQTAKTALTPADIVWAVDTSCSMIEEAAAVQANINNFSQQIVGTGIDAHVVMLASYPIFFLPGVCVGAPLGTGACPPNGTDTKLPSFFHHPNAIIGSVDAAPLLIQYFPDYRNMLRPNALKHIVVVTDDDSRSTGGSGSAGPYDNNPDLFIADYTKLDPMLATPTGGPNWKLNAIYAHSQCPIAAAEGLVWRQIVDKTGGVHGDMCACVDAAACAAAFQGIFNELATKIVEGAQPIDCEWAIPAPPQGQQFDPEKVNVELIDQINGTKETIYHVADQASCDPVLGGWYYDNNAAPTKVISCPSSCDVIKGTTQGRLDVLFGCATQDIPR